MRTVLIILVSVLLSVAATVVYLQSKETGGASVSTGYSTEVYDRVIKSGVLRCGYSPWPPFVDKDPNTGAMSGILVDVVEEMGKVLRLKIDWAYETGYGNYNEDLKMNRFDVMCATLWSDYARLRTGLLIAPQLYTGVYMVVRADDERFDDNITALNDPAFTVTAIDGDITATLAQNLFPKARHVTVPNIGSPAALMLNVETGKADASFADLGFFNDYDKKNPGKLKALTANPAWVFGEHMAVKDGEWRLKYMLDSAIAELTNSGKIDAIMAKYPGTSTVSPAKTFDGLPNN